MTFLDLKKYMTVTGVDENTVYWAPKDDVIIKTPEGELDCLEITKYKGDDLEYKEVMLEGGSSYEIYALDEEVDFQVFKQVTDEEN